MTVKVAVIYYSATGTVHALAQAVAEGAASAGAEVRLRRVAELAPDRRDRPDPQWRRHADAARSVIQARSRPGVGRTRSVRDADAVRRTGARSSSSSSTRRAGCGRTAGWPTSPLTPSPGVQPARRQRGHDLVAGHVFYHGAR